MATEHWPTFLQLRLPLSKNRCCFGLGGVAGIRNFLGWNMPAMLRLGIPVPGANLFQPKYFQRARRTSSPLRSGTYRLPALAASLSSTARPIGPVAAVWLTKAGCTAAAWPLFIRGAHQPRLPAQAADAPVDVDVNNCCAPFAQTTSAKLHTSDLTRRLSMPRLCPRRSITSLGSRRPRRQGPLQ